MNSENLEQIKRQIEAILLEIQTKEALRIEEILIRHAKDFFKKEIFLLKDYLLAWRIVLEKSQFLTEKEKMVYTLLGIALATIYERGKEKGGKENGKD